MKHLAKILLTSVLTILATTTFAQPVPGDDENIPYLVTFGKNSMTEWGDDNFVQIIFFSVPADYTSPIYIRIFDPDCGGKHDEIREAWNTKTRFSIYGGVGSCSNKDAQHSNVNGKYKSGTMLATKTFGSEATYDDKWYTFGPFNPSEGENLPEYGGRTFKVVVEGMAGDDGNMYRMYLSKKKDENVKVDGASAYYFKYKFRLHDSGTEISHIYPYIDDKTISLKQSNFDWDNDGMLRIISVAKNGEMMKVSNNDEWATSTHKVVAEEKNTSWDIQMVKYKNKPLKNNNVVIFLENQYGELMPFYSVPIGGIPKYKYSIGIKPKKN
ncbi:MAG: hypothetical protein ACI35U_08870 [Marinilabiliaceae bacterium]|nr:hypothetical protein [Bacteroidales bacterium]MDY4521517.1 hypothetical protein [Bacteroidales bacterium]